jgi:hypothetical protein
VVSKAGYAQIWGGKFLIQMRGAGKAAGVVMWRRLGAEEHERLKKTQLGRKSGGLKKDCQFVAHVANKTQVIICPVWCGQPVPDRHSAEQDWCRSAAAVWA